MSDPLKDAIRDAMDRPGKNILMPIPGGPNVVQRSTELLGVALAAMSPDDRPPEDSAWHVTVHHDEQCAGRPTGDIERCDCAVVAVVATAISPDLEAELLRKGEFSRVIEVDAGQIRMPREGVQRGGWPGKSMN